jgi:drug/metabolite transporter (DMT)-like permease
MRWQPCGDPPDPACQRRVAVALFVLVSVLFGSGFVGIKSGLDALPPLWFAALRFDVGAAAILAVVLATRSDWLPRTRGDCAGIAAAAVFLFAINGGLLFLGQRTITSAAAAVMYGLLPVLAPLFAALLLAEERLDAVGAVGVLVGLAGVVVIVGADPAALVGSGQALVALAAAAIALGSVLLRRVDPWMGTLPLTAWGMVGGAVLLHAASLALGEPPVVPRDPAIVGSVLWVGLPATGAAFPAYFALVRRSGPIRANLTAYAVPIVAAVVGWVVLGEQPSLRTGVGFVIVASGFALVERDGLRAELGTLRESPGTSESVD